jgi:hypothetical protein
MALVRFHCSDCQTTLKVNDPTMVGKKIRCPKCSAISTVPAPAVAAVPSPEPAPPKPAPAPTPAAAAAGTDDIETLFFESLSAMESSEKPAPAPTAEEEPAPAPVAKAPDEPDAVIAEEPLEEWAQEGVAAPEPSAMFVDEVEEEPIRRPAKVKVEEDEEDEDHPPRKPAKPLKKKRGIPFVAIVSVLLALVYLGALGAAWQKVWIFEENTVPIFMTPQQAKQHLHLPQ